MNVTQAAKLIPSAAETEGLSDAMYAKDARCAYCKKLIEDRADATAVAFLGLNCWKLLHWECSGPAILAQSTKSFRNAPRLR